MVENKKGQSGLLGAIAALAIIMGVLIFLVIGYFFLSLVAPVATDVFNQVSTITLDSVPLTANAPVENNLSILINQSIGSVNRTAQSNMEWFTYGIFFAIVLSFLISAYYVNTKGHAVFIVVWILFMIIMSFVSIFLAVTYNDVRQADSYLNGIYTSWEFNDYLLQYLPFMVIGLMVLGGIILFAIKPDSTTGELAV